MCENCLIQVGSNTFTVKCREAEMPFLRRRKYPLFKLLTFFYRTIFSFPQYAWITDSNQVLKRYKQTFSIFYIQINNYTDLMEHAN